MICPLVAAVRKHRAVYYYYSDKSPQRYANFADYQLRHAKWLPCKPSLFHADQRVAPCEAFLPGSGLGGLFPEVDKGNMGDKEWYSSIDETLQGLGVRDKLGATLKA